MRYMVVSVCAFSSAVLGLAAEPRRELGPHEHGHGHGHGFLNIAMEQDKVSMGLDVPGADIVGFEHSTDTPDQKAAVEAGKMKLADALSLIQLPSEAGCAVKEVKVDVEGSLIIAAQAPGGNAASEKEVEHQHAGFTASYELECAKLSAVTRIDFEYFRAFPGAKVLSVTVITPKSQAAFEVTRAKPTLSLSGFL